LRGLEDEVGELTTGDLVLVDLRIGTGETSLEGRVDEADLCPVAVNGAKMLRVEASLKLATFKRCHKGTNGRLGSHARHAVSGSVNSISTGLGASNHGSNTGTGGVVGVDVDGEIGVLLPDGTNEKSRGARLENTSHIFDA